MTLPGRTTLRLAALLGVGHLLSASLPAQPATKSLIHRGRETLKQKLKPYLQTGAWHGPK